MIEVKNLTKRFDGFTALNGLTMTVPTGSVYGLVGPNGAGKSTIIRHITGVYRPDLGEVLVGGEPVFENPPVKARIACIPDDLSCHAGASIRELKTFYALGDIFKLDQRQPLRRFSKGMQKQAAFWLAICTQPDYLVLDEPVDGLDPVMRKQVWSVILEDVATRGTTVLVSSHNLRELEDVCDHVGVLHEGKMLLERSLSDLQENIVKVQLVTDRPIPPELNVLHKSMTGRIQTLIVRGDRREIAGLLQQCNPLLCDLLPLSLEEIFIYELGGVNYDVKNLVL